MPGDRAEDLGGEDHVGKLLKLTLTTTVRRQDRQEVVLDEVQASKDAIVRRRVSLVRVR